MDVLSVFRAWKWVIWALWPHYNIIIASPGDNVTLVCVGPEKVSISASEWIKRALNNVILSLLNRGEGQAVAESDFPPLEGLRLMDSEMKNNNMSAILENLQMNATGIYECHIYNGTRDPLITTSTYGTSPIEIFYLLVLDGGLTTFVLVPIFAAIIVVALGFGVRAIFKRYRPNAEQNSNPPSSNVAYRNQNGGEVYDPLPDGEHN